VCVILDIISAPFHFDSSRKKAATTGQCSHTKGSAAKYILFAPVHACTYKIIRHKRCFGGFCQISKSKHVTSNPNPVPLRTVHVGVLFWCAPVRTTVLIQKYATIFSDGAQERSFLCTGSFVFVAVKYVRVLGYPLI
jgi:hypothetical protein